MLWVMKRPRGVGDRRSRPRSFSPLLEYPSKSTSHSASTGIHHAQHARGVPARAPASRDPVLRPVHHMHRSRLRLRAPSADRAPRGSRCSSFHDSRRPALPNRHSPAGSPAPRNCRAPRLPASRVATAETRTRLGRSPRALGSRSPRHEHTPACGARGASPCAQPAAPLAIARPPASRPSPALLAPSISCSPPRVAAAHPARVGGSRSGTPLVSPPAATAASQRPCRAAPPAGPRPGALTRRCGRRPGRRRPRCPGRS